MNIGDKAPEILGQDENGNVIKLISIAQKECRCHQQIEDFQCIHADPSFSVW